MATNGNMDWTHAAPSGYVPAFRSGNMNGLGSSTDPDVSYLLRNDPSVTSVRSPYPPYATGGGHHASNNQFAPGPHNGLHATGGNIDEHFWQPPHNAPLENDHVTHDHTLHEHAHHGHAHDDQPQGDHQDDDSPHEDPDNDDDIPDDGAVANDDPAYGRGKAGKTKIPRSERRKHYKPKPEPSNPRLFRPFDNLETVNTMLPQWRTPPVWGTWLMFPNKKLKYNPMPPRLDAVRERLFSLTESVLLKNSQEVADYLPHVTNFWRRAVQRVEIDEKTGIQTEFWHCRSKKVKKPPRRSDNPPKGIRNREKKSQIMFDAQDLCRMRIRVTSFTKHADTGGNHERWGGGDCGCVAEWVHFERANVPGHSEEHTHTLETMEKWKRSEAIAILAKVKCEEGNSYAAVAKWMRKMYGDHTKQVFHFEKGDVANAAQAWRNDHKDLVLREEVPEDSDEMTTMRKCVDEIIEADADSLRAALREVLKDSDALTKKALAILEKCKPSVPAAEAEKEEPFFLAEDVAMMDLPPPGASMRLKTLNAGVQGPSLNWPDPRHRETVPVEAIRFDPTPILVGRAGNPIPPNGFGVLKPGPITPAHQRALAFEAQQRMLHAFQPQPASTPLGNTPQAGGVPIQPRPPPTALGQRVEPVPQPRAQPEVRYVTVPGPAAPALPPQQPSSHPITISMEVPSCTVPACRQCRHMRRAWAGRTFLFQDRLVAASQFQKLRDLLSDPKQLITEQYTGVITPMDPRIGIANSALAPVHPLPNPKDASRPPAKRTPAGKSTGGRLQKQTPVAHMQPQPQPQAAFESQFRVEADNPKPADAEAGGSAPPSGAGPSNEDSTVPPEGQNGSAPPAPQPQPTPTPAQSTSVYDKPLPVHITIEDDDDNDNDDDEDEEADEQPPAKRQRQEPAEEQSGS